MHLITNIRRRHSKKQGLDMTNRPAGTIYSVNTLQKAMAGKKFQARLAKKQFSKTAIMKLLNLTIPETQQSIQSILEKQETLK